MRWSIWALSLLLVCACASEEERGCVTVKRHSKAGKIALQAASIWCVTQHAPRHSGELLELIGLARYRLELTLAGPDHCDLSVGIQGHVENVEYEGRFDCRIDVPVLDDCLETASSVIDVTACTERSMRIRR